jgi:hypothetical protein
MCWGWCLEQASKQAVKNVWESIIITMIILPNWQFACLILVQTSRKCPDKYENTPFDPFRACFATLQNEPVMAAKSGQALINVVQIYQ